MSELDDDTAVTRAEWDWAGEVSRRWSIGVNPNGGYLVSLAARAMLADSGQPDPWTVTAHFLSPPAPGPVSVRTEVVKPGRTYSTVAASLVQGDRERVRLLGAFGDLSARRGPTRVTALPPPLPPPDECVALADLSGPGKPAFVQEIMHRFDLRLPRDTRWGSEPTAGEPFEIAAWIRLADGSDPSGLALLTFVDACPPALIGAMEVGWVPTVEMTTHVRARPAPGWLRGVFRTRVLVDGMLEEDGEVWDAENRLVALSRQIALALPPA